MWLVLCTSMDASALWASQGLKARGLEPLERVSAEMLAQSQRWEHRVDAKSATIDITLADGRHIRNDAIQGVLNRLVCVPFELLRLAHPADREQPGRPVRRDGETARRSAGARDRAAR